MHRLARVYPAAVAPDGSPPIDRDTYRGILMLRPSRRGNVNTDTARLATAYSPNPVGPSMSPAILSVTRPPSRTPSSSAIVPARRRSARLGSHSPAPAAVLPASGCRHFPRDFCAVTYNTL